MTQPYQIDNPELESVSIRVYPPIASANLAAQGSVTKSVKVLNRQTYPSDFNGPQQKFLPAPFGSTDPTDQPIGGQSGPAQQQYTTTTTTTGPSTSVTSGSFSNQSVEFKYFLEYFYDESYLTPSDSWSFTLPADQLGPNDLAALKLAARVEVRIDGNVQSIGYIDDLRWHGSRGAGSLLTVTGRDWLSPAVDAHIDPQILFKPSMSLSDIVTKVFTPFGVQNFVTDNLANRNAITGAKFGAPTTKKGKTLKSYKSHLLKPYQREGAFAFASRVSQRFGLWLRPAADGQTLICATPDFDQDPIYGIRLKKDGSQFNNVTDWDVTMSRAEQASIIFGSGVGGGGVFANSTLRGAILNPIIALANPNVIGQLLAAYPGLVGATPLAPAIISSTRIGSIMFDPFARPLYLYDDESHDAAELRAYLQREMSILLRKSFIAKYTLMGHKLGGNAIAVDTVIDIDDDISDFHQPAWIIRRTFHKAAGETGTRTTIEAIRLGTLQFGPGTGSV